MQRNAHWLSKFGSPLTPNGAHTDPNTPRDEKGDPFSPVTPLLLQGIGNGTTSAP